MSRTKPFLSSEEVAILGSYASFFGFLLIATLLSYRQIFLSIGEALLQGHPEWNIWISFSAMAAVFILVFVAIPTYPAIRSIYSAWKEKRQRLAAMLTFLLLVYDVVLIFQLVHAYIEFAGHFAVG